MTIVLYVSLFIIWLLGYVNAVQAFSDDDTATSRLAVNVACALWPIAICVAIVNVLVKDVFGIGNKSSTKDSRKGEKK